MAPDIVQGDRFFSSPKLENLTMAYPPKQTLGMLYAFLKGGMAKPGYGSNFFANSPASNPEAERFFGELIAHAVSRQQWVGYDTLWMPGKIKYVQRAMKEGIELSPEARGIWQAYEKRLITLGVIDGRVYAVPTEEFIQFVAQRVKEKTGVEFLESIVRASASSSDSLSPSQV